MPNNKYTIEELSADVDKLSKLIFVNTEGIEQIPTLQQIENLLPLNYDMPLV